MVYVHLIEETIPASAADVWHLLGTNFANTSEWSTKYNTAECRPIIDIKDIPKQFLPTHPLMHYNIKDIKQSSSLRQNGELGRIVPNPFFATNTNNGSEIGSIATTSSTMKKEMKQIITFYSPSRKTLTYVCSYPLPIVDFYECTIIVTDNKRKNNADYYSNNSSRNNDSKLINKKDNTVENPKKKTKMIIKKTTTKNITNINQLPSPHSEQNNTITTTTTPNKRTSRQSSTSRSSHSGGNSSNYCTVEMECEFFVVPGFCWLAQLLGLSSKIRTDSRGPAGDLIDIKTYFQNKQAEKAKWDNLLSTTA